MFESGVAEWAVVGAVDEAGGSLRRWAILLVSALVAVLGLLWYAKRSATDDVVPVPDASGPG